MPAAIDIPVVVKTVDQNIRGIVSSAWARRNQNAWWKRMVRARPSTTKKETLQWLLETAKIRDLGNGGRTTFGDMMAAQLTIENDTFGDALNISRQQLTDAQGSDVNTGGAFDYAASWARHMGNWGAYWPQFQASQFMKGIAPAGSSATITAYDGQAFFSLTHPVNPVSPASASTFTNVFYGMPLNAQNYALICAYIETIPAPDGRSRKVKPRIVAAAPDNRLTATQLFGTRSEFFTDPKNPNQAAAATNIVRTLYDTEPPIIDADLAFPSTLPGQGGANPYFGTWWIAAELVEDDELAGMIFQEREPFALNSYTPFSDPELARMESFEWKYVGRNAFSGGHPFLLFMCVPGIPPGQTKWGGP
jgi:hypothetical protein